MERRFTMVASAARFLWYNCPSPELLTATFFYRVANGIGIVEIAKYITAGRAGNGVPGAAALQQHLPIAERLV